MTLVCAYCGKKIGNEKYLSIENVGLWQHIKNKHWKQINPKISRRDLPLFYYRVLEENIEIYDLFYGGT